jgi:hypothetical protein
MSRTSLLTENELEDVMQMLSEGYTLREIGDKHGVSHMSVKRFLSLHPARAQEAYRESAQSMADLAIAVLKGIEGETTGDVMRDRELASHYRWEAKMRDRAKYGDKVEVENKPVSFTPDNFEALLKIAKENAKLPGTSE